MTRSRAPAASISGSSRASEPSRTSDEDLALAVVDQLLDEEAADEAGGAGDEVGDMAGDYVAGYSPLVAAGRRGRVTRRVPPGSVGLAAAEHDLVPARHRRPAAALALRRAPAGSSWAAGSSGAGSGVRLGRGSGVRRRGRLGLGVPAAARPRAARRRGDVGARRTRRLAARRAPRSRSGRRSRRPGRRARRRGDQLDRVVAERQLVLGYGGQPALAGLLRSSRAAARGGAGHGLADQPAGVVVLGDHEVAGRVVGERARCPCAWA